MFSHSTRAGGADAASPELIGFFHEEDALRKVDRSIAYMAAHLNRPLQVATLAAQANVSPSHFFALFKQRTGYPPMDYFTRLRMRRAGELLFSTSASVKEIAAALGYDDPFYFSRVFKSVHHLSPSHYRSARLNVATGEALAGNDTVAVRATTGSVAKAERASFFPPQLSYA